MMCDVLLVEDQPEVLELVQLALEMRGYIVEVCATAEAALERLLSSHLPQVLVTDIDLGRGPDGFAVVDAARRIRPDLRAIFYSGHVAPPAHRGLRPNECFLEKPFSRLALFDTLDELDVRPSGKPLQR
jgi:CheY-like chemotaxis protein